MNTTSESRAAGTRVVSKTSRRFAAFRADGSRVTGIVVPYGVASDIGRFRETIMAGAFGDIGEVRVNVQHDRGRAFGVNRAGGGLELEDGLEALRAAADLPEHGEGPAIRELVERGVLTGFSVEMRVARDEWQGRDRTILQADLRDLALVDRPAHTGAVAQLEARWREYAPPSPRLDWWRY